MLKSLAVAVTFLTILPAKNVNWNKANLRYFILNVPLIGLMVGLIWLAMSFIFGQIFFKCSDFLKGALMTLTNLILTGGLHIDGFIDTCDALFSHKDFEARLKILSDTHTGAFGVAGCVMNLILKCALFAEIKFNYTLILIPVLSRSGMALLLNNLKFAKNDGLAKILGSSRVQHDNIWLIIIMLVSALIDFKLSVLNLLAYIFWRRCCMKNFNGITGDLLGAFVELDEIILLLGLCI